jgi:predicted ATPase
MHARVAKVLVDQFPDLSEAKPELLARHHTEAGELEPAVAAWRQAGERAVSRFAFAEGVGHLSRALEALRALPDTPARSEQELTLQITLGAALNQTRGFGAETAMAFARARELSDGVRDPMQLLLLLLGMWGAALARGDLHSARELAEQMVRTAEREGTRAWGVWAQVAEGIVRHTAGDLVAARDHLERAMTLYDEEDYRWWPAPPGPLALGHLACVLWTLGFAEDAHRRAEDALAAAQRRDEPNSVGQVQCLALLLCVLRREPTATIERANQLIQLSTDHSLSPIVEPTRVMRGWAVASLGRHDEGLAEMRQGLQGLQRMGQLHSHGFFLGLLADAYAQSGALGEALAVLHDGLVALGGEEVDKPELLRLRGDLLARQCADACEVEASYREAIDLAHRQGARMLELRALTSFGRWIRSRARSNEARALLAPLYASFTEGFETRDLREAKALLEELE